MFLALENGRGLFHNWPFADHIDKGHARRTPPSHTGTSPHAVTAYFLPAGERPNV